MIKYFIIGMMFISVIYSYPTPQYILDHQSRIIPNNLQLNIMCHNTSYSISQRYPDITIFTINCNNHVYYINTDTEGNFDVETKYCEPEQPNLFVITIYFIVAFICLLVVYRMVSPY